MSSGQSSQQFSNYLSELNRLKQRKETLFKSRGYDMEEEEKYPEAQPAEGQLAAALMGQETGRQMDSFQMKMLQNQLMQQQQLLAS